MDTQKDGKPTVVSLAQKVAALMDDADFRPTRIIAFAYGGCTILSAVGKVIKLADEKVGVGADSVVGVPVIKDDSTGIYRIAPWFVPLMRAICQDQVVLVLDDSSISGRLANGVADDCVKLYGALDARSCVLMASEGGEMSAFVGTTCKGKPPKFV